MLGTLPPGKVFVGGDEAGPCTARPNRRSRRPQHANPARTFHSDSATFHFGTGTLPRSSSGGAIAPRGLPVPYGRRIVGRLRGLLERRARGPGRARTRVSTGLTVTQNRPHDSSSIRIASSLTPRGRSGRDTEPNGIGVPLGYDLQRICREILLRICVSRGRLLQHRRVLADP